MSNEDPPYVVAAALRKGDRPEHRAQRASTNKTLVPPELIQKWQGVVNLIADLVRVPASLVMKVEPPEIVVIVASESEGNPYERGEKALLDTGLYCERVMSTRQKLLVSNALEDEVWKANPDLKLGMVSYLGFPICWPCGDIFGTICVLDIKANTYDRLHQALLLQFRDVIEADLKHLCNLDAQLAEETRTRLAESERARRMVSTLEDLRRAEEELRTSQQQLQEAVRLRDEFLAIASHELRTPITSLQLTIQGLTRGVVSPEHAPRALGNAERQIGRLTRLVDELLEASRIQAGRLTLHLERLDLVAVVQEAAQRFEAELARVGCTLSLSADRAVTGFWDHSKLDQIVTNILSNAIKFGAGHAIEILVEEAPPGIGRLVVTDHGIGIPPERLPYIFERFERAVSSREYGGLGLGLYIVRSIVEALGGTIRAESVPDSGSTFTVELACTEPLSPGEPLGD
jgi:signal transduction histidine kinase